MQVLNQMCKEIGLPMAPEMFVESMQCIEFLGMLIDSLVMVVRIPSDKIQK